MSSPSEGDGLHTKPTVARKPRVTNATNTALQCPLCRAPFDGSAHEPKLLPCHHSFCLSCLNELAQNRPQFRCPEKECRKKCAVPNGGIESLQANFYVNQMQSIMLPSGGETTQNKGNQCEKHLNQPLLFYCATCSVPICMNCTVLDHDKNAGHKITDIASVVKANQEVMKTKLIHANTSLADFQASLDLLKTEMSNLENTKDKTLLQLEETFEQLKTQLDERKSELTHKAEAIYNARRDVIVQHAQQVKTNAAHLNRLTETIAQSMQRMDIANATELAQSLHAITEIDQLCSQAKDEHHCDNGYVRFHFEHGLQEYLLSAKGLGAIICETGLPSKVNIKFNPLVASVKAQIKVSVSDINAQPVNNYPLAATFQRESSSPNAKEMIVQPHCNDNGVYIFEFTPQMKGPYTMQVFFNDKPIWGASKHLDVNPNNPVLTFGSEGPGAGQLNHPTSAAISSKGNIYVADMGNKRIQVFEQNGTPKTSFAVGGSKSTTYDVTINHATGELICSKVGPNDSGSTVGNTIRIFGLRGEKLHNFSNHEMQRAMFVAVNSKGQIITTDSQQNCVYIYSKEGVPIKKFGSLGYRQMQFNFPSAVAVGKEDSILVSDTKNNRIQILNKTGKFMRQIGPEIDSQDGTISIEAPRGITADSGHILVADSLNRILVFTWNIQLVGIIGSENEPISEPYNLALSGDGHVIVADYQNNCIKKYRYK